MLVLISGVSGSGKDTVIKRMLKKDLDLKYFPSFTTRDKRPYEEDGVDYFFVSKEKFKKMIENNEFFEYSIHHNNYYGTARSVIESSLKKGKRLIKDIDVNGATTLRNLFGEKEILTIYLDISKEEMKKRLLERGDLKDKKDFEKRLERYEYEESFLPQYDYVIKNYDLEKTVNKVYNIIKKEIEQRKK